MNDDEISASSAGSGNVNKASPIRGVEDSDNMSSTGGSTVASSKGSSQKVKFTQKESKYVLYLRILVLMILVLAAISVCCVVYLVTDSGETSTFESQYTASAEKLKTAFLDVADSKIGAIGSLVVAAVAEGISMGRSWPFVTLPSFQERAYTVKKLSGALYIGMNPLVTDANRKAWENYTTGEASMWYQESREYQDYLGIDDFDNRPQVQTADPNLILTTGIANHIYDFQRETTGKGVISPKSEWYLPIWQTSPVTKRSMVNQNRASNSEASIHCIEQTQVVFEGMQYSTPGYGSDDNPKTAEIAWLLRLANQRKTLYEGDIFSNVYFPLYSDFSFNRTVVGVMRTVIHWARFFENILPASAQGIVVVLENGCDQPYTYRIDGPTVTLLGHGDLHDSSFDQYMHTTSFVNVTSITDGTRQGLELHHGECEPRIRIYPSSMYLDQYTTSTPMVITLAVAIVFTFTICMFFVYDWLVERRQKILLDKATRTHQIVASLFPKHVRDQILHEDQDGDKKNGSQGKASSEEDEAKALRDAETTIADLYPEASVLFADIAGFTAWSSSREPQQVFVLLQNIYKAFDDIAKKRKVFKVETIGDCYVAAAGVPEPQPTHAVIICRFAWECLLKMQQVTRDLESVLGPDTGELSMRFGIHSGPVTAGVLKGDRSRFQLFGDTVNTAARMESTGIKGRVHCSQSTAEALTIAGKEHWFRPRNDIVEAKGKGVLKTFWVVPQNKALSSSAGTNDTGNSEWQEELEIPQVVHAQHLLKRERQIDWVTETLLEHVRQIIALREMASRSNAKLSLEFAKEPGRVPLDDVVDSLQMPEFNAKVVDAQLDAKSVRVPEKVKGMLRQYVSIISSAYRDNPFHNFEHACHVTMSVSKFLKRIVSPKLESLNSMMVGRKLASHLHEYTHGLTSDPIMQLGIVFSAVIHDVDHRGISNIQLGKEQPGMSTRYRGKSLAEQNSFEISWDLLMSDHFEELRNYMFGCPDDLLRFRQIVINVVLATDIFDKELNELRKNRWMRAFVETSSGMDKETNALRATTVIEHIMQASDVCHVMQHWHVYRKWNRRLFHELLLAYRDGRMAADPAKFWYEGELNFFDNYIIPLARKLQDCNVFGVSSDECLNYAIRNRAEWESRGAGIVEEMIEEFSQDKV